MGDSELPILRPPRRLRTTQAFLAGRLEPGETVTKTVRMLTGSPLAYLAVALPALLLWFAGWGQIYRSRSAEVVFGVVLIVGYVAIILIAQWLVMKPRLLVLTDRRLFILRLSPPFERVVGVETEARRTTVHIDSKGWGRLLVSGASEHPVTLRIPWVGALQEATFVEDWAGA